ncbi:MAG: hypothetical protein GX221_04090 [Candidatus Riflebacteria bacterium]|nr:hypothetical protein [Candidatus Riflebacteria bacterium]
MSLLDANTKLYALIGHPVSHSSSPIFWNAALKEAGINSVYLAFDIKSEDFPKALESLQTLGVVGANITAPLKQKAFQICPDKSETVMATGSANTLAFAKDGSISAWNTDFFAISNIISKFSPKGKTVLILGNGASASTAAYAALKNEVSKIILMARNFPEKGLFKCAYSFPENLIESSEWTEENLCKALQKSHIIINTATREAAKEKNYFFKKTTPVKEKIFIDFNYAEDPQLLMFAYLANCIIIDGREILLLQGAKAFEILTGSKPPFNTMKEAIYRKESRK